MSTTSQTVTQSQINSWDSKLSPTGDGSLLSNILTGVNLISIQDEDILMYDSIIQKWKNKSKQEISDGGNF